MTANAPDAGLLYDNEKLRAWRLESGLTREQVWSSVGVSVSWLADLERGRAKGKPSLDLLVRLARLYGHDAADLLTGQS
jgi:transcriptional regulator with XRE-family HTH domain